MSNATLYTVMDMAMRGLILAIALVLFAAGLHMIRRDRGHDGP